MSSLSDFELYIDGNATRSNSQFEDPFLDSYSGYDVDICQLPFDNSLFDDNIMIPWPDIDSTTPTWGESTLSDVDQLSCDSSIITQPSPTYEIEHRPATPSRTPSTASVQQTDNSSFFITFPLISSTSSDGSQPDSENSPGPGPQIPRPKRLRRLDRQMRRREQNRASQKRYRASKEAKLQDAHERIRSLELHLELQIERNVMLEREWSRMKTTFESLNKSL